ncbi:MAG TPA: DUF3047 domain-containing protein [Burkholderiaceae bacterium]|nr:DUF3047 domain-containing protein [Burkholderiaceae bacterium]
MHIALRPLARLVAGLMPVLALAQGLPADTKATRSALLSQHRFSAMDVGAVAPPWRLVGLPGQKMALTRFAIVRTGDMPVLRLQADASYGNLVLDMAGASITLAEQLRWRWQLARAPERTDLRRKDGDDTPVKVCALFDMPLQGMSFGEQTRLRMARALSGEALPSATLCYVWDAQLPVGTALANVFSPRVRYLVAGQGPARPGQWLSVERNLASDFLRAFGHETTVVPPLLALAVGADTDNTGSSSLAYVGDLDLAAP